MNIRLAQRSDIVSIQKIAQESWHHTYKGIIPEKIQNDFLYRAYSKELLLKRFTQSYFFVAERDEQVIAFANFSYKNIRGESELGAIYIKPDFQGQHVGSEFRRRN
ncbi:GNAT family N-acetyltransferase [Terrilactibacillus sp. S3-3]|nr:GNAT family N-acetyltransferase [Terrilactibacillus sp. S3-3]